MRKSVLGKHPAVSDASRRRFLKCGSLATMGIASQGCGWFWNPSLPTAGVNIDAHCHIFNARDLPIRSFAERVIFKEMGHSLRGVLLAFQNTLQTPAPGYDDEKQLLLGLIEGIEADFDLLEDTVPPPGLVDSVVEQIRTVDPDAYEDLYERFGLESGLEADGALLGTVVERAVNWAYLMTRYRTQLATKIATTFDQISLFTPSVVDFDLWLDAGDDVKTSIREQIELYGLLSEWSEGRFHGFVAFDPLRQATVPDSDGGTLSNVKSAVTEHGFLGVKLYPPMGFRPLGNEGLWPDGDVRNGLDTVLKDLYEWCQEERVPILAHCNETNGAGPGFASRASPEYWAKVLEKYSDLKLLLGHFGGVPGVQDQPQTSWAFQIGELIESYPYVFADTSFHTTALDDPEAEVEAYLDGLEWLVDRFPKVKKRLVYGSDWQMTLIEEGHAGYFDRYRGQIDARFGNQMAEEFTSETARVLLGIDEEGGNRERLEIFYASRQMEKPSWWRSV